MPYFNYETHAVHAQSASFWDRRDFVNAWWSIFRDDSRWTPPEYGWLRRELDPRRNSHLARLEATLVRVEALYRTGVSRSRTDQQEIALTSVLERPLAAAVVIIDPRRRGKTAHLAWPHLGNDREALDRLYYHLVESLSDRGYHRIVGPVGLSSHLGSGLLVDRWDEWPPLHTPSNPPYVPELIEQRFRPFQSGRLYRTAIPPDSPPPAGPAAISVFDPARLAADLLPLLAAAVENPIGGFPPPDADEARFLLRQLRGTAPTGFLAQIDGTPAGFILLGPVNSDQVRAARGGRSAWGRVWLAATRNRPAGSGRIWFGAVRSEMRGRGVGRQLWLAALAAGRERGWRALTAGPVWLPGQGTSPAVSFLQGVGMESGPSYRLYEATF